MKSDKKSRYKNKQFYITFTIVVTLLATLNHLFIHSQVISAKSKTVAAFKSNNDYQNVTTKTKKCNKPDSTQQLNIEIKETPTLVKCKVWSYDECFSDSNHVQLNAAERIGIRPLSKRKQIYNKVKKHELSNINYTPYYHIEELTHSQPYLVPKAQQLLNTIGINFIDSLMKKGMYPHIPIVTSVLRVDEDIKELQKGNINSVTKSCHQYGTTIDITYNRFMPVGSNQNEPTRYDDNMKRVLAEVLYDLKNEGLCYVKYERRQACFHLTAR